MTPSQEKNRLLWVDVSRGVAIMLMVTYHFCFDLNYFGLVQQDFNGKLFWLVYRAVIVTFFLTLVGISLVLASHRSQRHFWVRISKLTLAALAVTVGSYLLFPSSFIFFGVLHFIVLASLMARFFLGFVWLNLALGSFIVVMGIFFSNPVFDHPWLQWIGLMTYKPITEDYVPLFPWFGVVLIGLFFGKYFFQQHAGRSRWVSAKNKLSASSEWAKLPAWLGQHSLAVYLLHQPLLIGVLYLLFGH